MNNCSNCYGGCADIISDKCVKYTGIDVPGLGIENGDSLLVVENKIVEKILTLMDGSGIIPDVDHFNYCELVSNYLPSEGDITLNDVIKALYEIVCELNDRLLVVEEAITDLYQPFTLLCLDVEDPTPHNVIQALISKVCDLETDLNEFKAEVDVTYVKISDLDDLIQTYLDSIPGADKFYTKMIPFVAVPYFGPLSNYPSTGDSFDIDGAGQGAWEQVYLCNGIKAPDLRGVGLVGATDIAGGAFDPKVNPATPGNPTYSVNDVITGDNTITLITDQLPSHEHGAEIEINDPGHLHTVGASGKDNGENGGLYFIVADNPESAGNRNIGTAPPYSGPTPTPTGLKGNESPEVDRNVFVTVNSTGADEAHSNIQPVKAANYIMYIPS